MTNKKYLIDKYGIKAHNKKVTVHFHRKLSLKGGLLIEIIFWKDLPISHYPLGIKYRLVLVNPITAEVILLYDNHWPKGPHIHGPEGERSYHFIDKDKVTRDFELEAKKLMRKYY